MGGRWDKGGRRCVDAGGFVQKVKRTGFGVGENGCGKTLAVRGKKRKERWVAEARSEGRETAAAAAVTGRGGADSMCEGGRNERQKQTDRPTRHRETQTAGTHTHTHTHTLPSSTCECLPSGPAWGMGMGMGMGGLPGVPRGTEVPRYPVLVSPCLARRPTSQSSCRGEITGGAPFR